MAWFPSPEVACMAERDVNGLYQQMGEVLEGLRSLSAITEIRHSQAEKLHDLVAGDLVALRRAHGDLYQPS
jgi:hypothetical protein